MKKILIAIVAVFWAAAYCPAEEMGHDMKGSHKGSMNEAVMGANEEAYGKPTGKSASARINATAAEASLDGDVRILETDKGVVVYAFLSDVVTAGNHGIHIHAEGSCEEEGKAAGGHFNPDGVGHGLLPNDGHQNAHVGDMGNIEIDETGFGRLQVFLPDASLTEGKYNVTGKAIIVHEKADDFGQPTGNAGGRIGCGIITLMAP